MPTFVFGNNQDGQLGVPCLQDIESKPLLNDRLENITVKHCSMSLHQSSIITSEGVLLTCGANDQNELGRCGKRSAFNRVDSLETFRVRDFCFGLGFAVIVLSDGRIMSWGRNEMGQLGNGTRIFKEKIRFTAGFSHRIIQVSAGSQHVLALTREGNVISWGGNRKGQLGDGLFTSSCEAKVIVQLRHRPVVLIACGEEHSLALTSGGNVYSWGSNSHGQLGLGDCKNRLRPEIIRTLKAVKVVKIAAGGNHSLAISDSLGVRIGGGLLFSFGSNSCGQLGQQDYRVSSGGGSGGSVEEEGERIFPTPTICDRLSERYLVLDAECGHAHSLVVCRDRTGAPGTFSVTADAAPVVVFAMGMNSMGQCGLGHCQHVSRPTLVQFPALPPPPGDSGDSESDGICNGDGNSKHSSLPSIPQPSLTTNTQYQYASIFSGPLANHSMVCLSSSPLPARLSLPSVHIPTLAAAVTAYTEKKDATSLTNLRELIADSFSSLAVLNASFRYERDHVSSIASASKAVGGSPTLGGRVVGAAIGLDLVAVRYAYSLILSAGSDQVISTLGRATLAVSDKLKECPFDDPENLSVFLIVLENPLLLRPASFHVALQRVVSGILAIPQAYRVMFFGWMKHFPSEYFSQIVLVMQSFLSFILTDRVTKLDPTPVVLVLESLYTCNLEANIIPNTIFYNDTISEAVNLTDEWRKYQTSDNSKVFNFFSYPYLIPVAAKYKIIRLQFEGQMALQALQHSSKYLQHRPEAEGGGVISYLPRGTVPVLLPAPATSSASPRFSVRLELIVDRDRVLDSLLEFLPGVLHDDPASLLLPVCVRFIGETDVVDEGGVTRELFNLAIREFVLKKSCLGVSGVSGDRLFFTRTTLPSAAPTAAATQGNQWPEEFMLGVIVGLACYNGVLVNLPLVDIVYKLFNNGEPSLDDLWSADPELARSIQLVADYSGDDSLVDLFGLDFTASCNPLVPLSPSSPHDVAGHNEEETLQQHYAFVNLKPHGEEINVDRSNRKEFVRLFVRHALYSCCKEAIDAYLRGLRIVLKSTTALSLCTSEEIEYVICGSSEIGDICELRQFTTYLGEFHDHHPVIEYFWTVLAELPLYQQRQFLFFVTATDRIPVGGLSMIRLTIQPSHQDANALPAAHTCFSVLDLPALYPSAAVLKERLLTALQHSQGFGLA